LSVRIRCKRLGRRNRPFYRISVFDVRTRRNGASIEDIGHYDPLAKTPENALKIDGERAVHWLNQGAMPSETVASIFKRLGIARTVVSQRKRRPRPRGAQAKAGPPQKRGRKARRAAKQAKEAGKP
jgi:small subunit ribosomal protein S16